MLMTNTLQKYTNIIDQYADVLRREYHVKNVGIFGSFVKGHERTGSDIDILVEFAEPIGFFKFIELEEFLSSILKRKVDLVTKAALKPAIKKEVLKELVYV